jgi:NodT family efflux transporter outer membrane factor (OMF) lipoprotein
MERMRGSCVGLALVAACAVGPNIVKSEAATTAAWATSAQGTTAASDDAALRRWWSAFNDPVLTGLVERAPEANLDVRQAKARLQEARARRGSATADLAPTVSTSASASRSTGLSTSGVSGNLFQAGLDASWELDLFGGKRRAIESAAATEQAAVEDVRDAWVSVAAEIGLAYIDLRTIEHRVRLAKQSLQALEETATLTRWRAQAGLTTDLDVQQARANVEQERAAIPALESQAAGDRNALAVLVGAQPGTLALTEQNGSEGSIQRTVAVGVPADALRRRPDVRREEWKLAAQTAEVGVAQAKRFPTLTLSGSIGLESLTAGGLLGSNAVTSSLGAGLLAPIFNAGKLAQNVRVQEAILEQSLLSYRSAVLSALKDVENALVAFDREQARRDALKAAADAAQRAATLAREQYASGLVEFTSVLDAQRTLLNVQDSLASSEGSVGADLIRLYKALGGDWTIEDKI